MVYFIPKARRKVEKEFRSMDVIVGQELHCEKERRVNCIPALSCLRPLSRFVQSLFCSKSLSGDGIRMTTLEASDVSVLILTANKNILILLMRSFGI